MNLANMQPRPEPGVIHVLIEVPAGSRNKYEYDAAAECMALDTVLHSSVVYPFDYGFVPNTMAEDGDPLDAMVIMGQPTFAGCLIRGRPIGILAMVDHGCRDEKLLCVPRNDPRLEGVRSIRQIASQRLEEVAEFFRIYKNFKGERTEILGWQDAEGVDPLLNRCCEAAAAATSVRPDGSARALACLP